MANTNLLQGEVVEKPEEQKLEVELLLAGLLKSLLEEQDAGSGKGARE